MSYLIFEGFISLISRAVSPGHWFLHVGLEWICYRHVTFELLHQVGGVTPNYHSLDFENSS